MKLFDKIKKLKSLWKEVVEADKKRQYEEANKKKCLSADLDFNYFEKWIQEINDNPNLNVTFKLLNGEVITVNAYKEKHDYDVKPYTGDNVVEEIQW